MPEPTDGYSLKYIGRAQYVLFGEETMWQTINRFLRENPDERFFGEFQIPNLLALAGKEEAALEWLERCIANYPHACWMMRESFDFVSLRQTEGFKALCRKCFPEQVKG